MMFDHGLHAVSFCGELRKQARLIRDQAADSLSLTVLSDADADADNIATAAGLGSLMALLVVKGVITRDEGFDALRKITRV